MAFFIEINKCSEDEEFVCYQYTGSKGKKFGRIKFNKLDGNYEILEVAEGDDYGAFSKRVVMKLFKLWKSGEYPDKTYWAS